jgi:transposase
MCKTAAADQHPAVDRRCVACNALGEALRQRGDTSQDRHDPGFEGAPVIPNRSNRKQPYSFSKRLYKLRWRIESAFNRLKDYRRIATRYDRLARNYLASVCLAAALVWWI